MRRKYVEQREKGGGQWISVTYVHVALCELDQQVYLEICKFIALETE